jgi:hypothetical protein
MFVAPAQTITWWQARASYLVGVGQSYNVQLSAALDYVPDIPPPPPAAPDASLTEGWDIGVWDSAVWDGAVAAAPNASSTGWVSIGVTGHSHAPIVQLTIAQSSKPIFDLIAIAATFKRMGINV